MEIDTCIEQFNVGPEEITQDVAMTGCCRQIRRG